jgi:peroxiredoxin
MVFAQESYEIGSQVEDFTLKNVDGEMISLSDYETEGVVIIFTCNHCPYAVKYEDRIIDFHNEYAPKGYPVLAINPNDPEVQPEDSFEKMQERAKEKNFPFKYIFDEGQEVYPKFGATRTPHVFLLDNERKLRYIGAIDDNYKDASMVKEHFLRDAVAALESGRQPDPGTTKAIGCSIKTK